MPATPDTAEKVIRFICGFLFGLVLAAGVGIRLASDGVAPGTAITISIAIAVLFGLGAMHYGDRFWESDRWRSW